MTAKDRRDALITEMCSICRDVGRSAIGEQVVVEIDELERAVDRLIWNTPLLDDCLRCPALCDKCATNAGSDACLESLREWATREEPEK
ncbi:MAG: hypothetical protein M0P69_20565 [Bacteroidales bacterium]|nr:hypothetical protein [Bacteroidales bacterium]